MGLHQAGFEVVGVDIKPQKRYPFKFFQADAMEFPLKEFDFIWASPPCQGYSHLTPKEAKDRHEKLIHILRARLIASGVPYCIENVAGAREELKSPIMLCGSMFGLKTRRHRFFETTFSVRAPKDCDHSEMPLLVTTASKASREKRFRLGLKPKTVKNSVDAYGIDWMTFAGLKEAIPPAYAKWIGEHCAQCI